jgi:hypothetical protein
VVKPQIGAAVFVARPSWWAVGGAVVLVAIAFAVQPSWITDWRAALSSPNVTPGSLARHWPPIAYPGGILILAALSRWRRPEARLLVAMALVPQTTMPHEAVPLCLVPRGWLESAAFAALGWAMVWWAKLAPMPTMDTTVARYGQAFVLFLYLPATIMVLRRPNEGPLPQWLESRISAWPAWIRGVTVHVG